MGRRTRTAGRWVGAGLVAPLAAVLVATGVPASAAPSIGHGATVGADRGRRARPAPDRGRDAGAGGGRAAHDAEPLPRLGRRTAGHEPRPAQARRGDLDRGDTAGHRAAQPARHRAVRAVDAGRPGRHRARRAARRLDRHRAGVGGRQQGGPGPGEHRRAAGDPAGGAHLDRPGDRQQRRPDRGGGGHPRRGDRQPEQPGRGHPCAVGRRRAPDDLDTGVHAHRARGDHPPHGGHERLLGRRVRGDRPGDLHLPRPHAGLGRHRLQRARRPVRHGVRGPRRGPGPLGDRRARRRVQPRDLRHRDDGRLHLGRPAGRHHRGDRAARGVQAGRALPRPERHGHADQRRGRHVALPGRAAR